VYYVPEASAVPNLSASTFSSGWQGSDIRTAYTQCNQATVPYAAQSGTALRVMSWAGQYWAAHYNNGMPPNSKACASGNDNSDYEAYPAMSRHPGGVNVGMGDASVRFIKNSINVQTWWALGTRAGGEIISSDSY
jgi:prepilin-type processing-associated H-X9-DG protein